MNTQAELKKRAQFIQKIRQFFDKYGVVEVQTPILLNAPTTDIYIDSLATQANGQNKYLHTSPELAMKKLIARGSGDIYQICPVFRDNEQGQRNFNEFTLLEYYRLGFCIHNLMDDIVSLLKTLGFQGRVHKLSYAQAFFDYANIDILNSRFEDLQAIAKTQHLSTDFEWIEDLQMLLFVHLIAPKITQLPICFIYDYPQQQAALAKTHGQIAHRFELYINGVEIANGYDELQNAQSYQQRFSDEINKRLALGKPKIALDGAFLSNLQNPLPQCAGVAIGIERLLGQIL